MTDSWTFAPLRIFGYDVIVADPPWDFELYRKQTGDHKGAHRYYETMPTADIAALPVGHLARGDCLLLLWACGCMLPQAIDVMTRWGFIFKSEIVWRKVFPSGAPRMGTGYRVRTMHEPLLLGTIGRPEHGAFPSVIDGVGREHSRKPAEVYRTIVARTPGAARCDLFARETRFGFSAWGDQLGKFDTERAA
jgi:N6-adenosine-specific RNA methylase IME4